MFGYHILCHHQSSGFLEILNIHTGKSILKQSSYISNLIITDDYSAYALSDGNLHYIPEHEIISCDRLLSMQLVANQVDFAAKGKKGWVVYSQDNLIVTSRLGQDACSVTCNREITSLNRVNSFIIVLHPDSMSIYTLDLQLIALTDMLHGVSSISVCGDMLYMTDGNDLYYTRISSGSTQLFKINCLKDVERKLLIHKKLLLIYGMHGLSCDRLDNIDIDFNPVVMSKVTISSAPIVRNNIFVFKQSEGGFHNINLYQYREGEMVSLLNNSFSFDHLILNYPFLVAVSISGSQSTRLNVYSLTKLTDEVVKCI